MQKVKLYKKLKNKIVECTACNHFCKIAPDKCGICGIRQNKNGELYSLVYGLTSGTQIDPIEKKPFFHFMPNSEVFSIGTIGCNFACSFCQNAWMSQCTKDKSVPLPELYKLTPKDIVKTCLSNDIKIIGYTYNEPAIFFEYAYDTAKLAHKAGIKNVWVSNGYASIASIDKIAPYLDAINIDLKSFSNKFYQKVCKAKLQPVLDNIKYYFKKKVWVEITTLIVPGENDSSKELGQIAQFVSSISKSIPWHVTAFSPAYKMHDKVKTSTSKLSEAYNIGKCEGLEYIYAGNVFGKDLHSTFCTKCQKPLIKRDWGYTKVVNLENGKCNKCGTKIKGVWK
ncbi:AmmeMemoRadiSam system radical SAM enzyme [Patescibacteria group bacterium]